MLLNRPGFIFVTGKGGVGKTTAAAGLAVAAAARGMRTRILSTDPAHSLSDILRARCGPRPMQIGDGLEAVEIDAEALARDHVGEIGRAMKAMAHPDTWPDIDRQLTASATAPGTTEAALVEYLAGELPPAARHCDLVILDTAPTGHTLRLLSLPEQLGDWTGELVRQRQEHDRRVQFMGDTPPDRYRRIAERLQQRRERLSTLRALLTDSKQSAALVVLTPERLPICESERLVRGLDRTGIRVAGLVINGLLPETSSDPFLAARRKLQETRLSEINQRFGDLERVHLPLSSEEPAGWTALQHLGERLLEGFPDSR